VSERQERLSRYLVTTTGDLEKHLNDKAPRGYRLVQATKEKVSVSAFYQEIRYTCIWEREK
jgi:hypothetical protein